MLLIIAINKGWYIWQYDVKNAFVHAKIDASIYTILPIGIYNHPKYANKYAKLNKALYGLKQSPRLWNLHLRSILYKLGFIVFPYDQGVYINIATQAILLCHMDDILFIHPSINYIKTLANELQKQIKIEEIGQLTTFLGNNIQTDYINKKIYIDQNSYTKKLLNKFNIYNNNKYIPKSIPGAPGIKLKRNTTQASETDIKDYQQQIGSLLYLALKTRPDINYTVNNCARFMSNPNKEHFNAIKNIWQYLLAYESFGLIYDCSGQDLYIKGYCDSDWGNDLEARKSTSAYIYSLVSDLGTNNPISWNTQLQKTIALSSCEAEYMALKEATKEAIYLNNMLSYLNNNLKLNYKTSIPTILVDSDSALKLAENPEFHKRSKHIDIIYHYTRAAIEENKIKLVSIPSSKNIADLLTKNTAKNIFKSLLQLINIGPINPINSDK